MGILMPPCRVGTAERESLNGLPFVVRRGFTHKTWYQQQTVKYCGYYEVSEAPTFKES